MKAVLLLCAVLFSSCLAATIVRDAYVHRTQDGDWQVVEGSSSHPNTAVAWAQYQDSKMDIGWDVLDLATSTDFSDDQLAYGAGYLEGYLTWKGIWDSWMNFVNGTEMNFTTEVLEWVQTNEAWYRSMAANSTDSYWSQVSLVILQFDGMVAGYNSQADTDKQLTNLEIMMYQLQFELGDIQSAVGQQDVSARLNMDNHCSSLIKPSADGEHLFAAHVTWSTFQCMLRIYKHYNMPFNTSGTASTKISFSSYPGNIFSGDDFYITNTNLVIIETTNEVFNMSLYKDFVHTNAVPYWIRIVVANRMASSGEEWSNIYSQYNSGTYNNQWIIVDQKLFTPGQPLQNNTLWILEQVPGYIVAEDKTDELIEKGYWASYNIPYYDFIYNVSGYPAYYEKYGNMWSWSECARAQIFRRDEAAVNDIEGMKSIMRYNDYQNDPLALKDACRGISARCDLNTPWSGPNTMNGWSAFGGIDAKITDNKLSASMKSKAVSGPTWEFQPPFAWTNQWSEIPHFGHPQVFDFEFEDMMPSDI